MKCCQSSATGFGGYAAPKIPAVGSCKEVAVNGAKKIVAAFPGRIRDIGCVRSCTCGVAGASDHCCGKATDMMCSDVTEVSPKKLKCYKIDHRALTLVLQTASIGGKDIAEWVMNNRASLNLKYVIWGQRIWSASEAVKPWSQWRTQEDRGNVRENHWYVFPDVSERNLLTKVPRDHVHVSYN